MPPLTLPPGNAAVPNRSSTKPTTIGSDDATTAKATKRFLKVCTLYDEDMSALNAEILIKHAALDFECYMQSFAFDELDPPGPGVTAARNASDSDILVVAIRDDRALPEHIQFWLGMCLGLRDEDQVGLLVMLTVKSSETASPDASLLDYLKTVAAIGGMEFTSRHRRLRRLSSPNGAPQFDGDFVVQN
jgi:hypothetical protein